MDAFAGTDHWSVCVRRVGLKTERNTLLSRREGEVLEHRIVHNPEVKGDPSPSRRRTNVRRVWQLRGLA